MSVFLPRLKMFSVSISLKKFSAPFLSLFPFWDPHHANMGPFYFCKKVLKLSLIFFFLFFSFFGPFCKPCSILVPQREVEYLPPAVGLQCPNHCTTREFQCFFSWMAFIALSLIHSSTSTGCH